jgi:hypothetical protein
VQTVRINQPAGKPVGALECLPQLLDARGCLRVRHGGEKEAGISGCIPAHVKPEHNKNAEVVKPGVLPSVQAHATACTAVARGFGNGRNVIAIRNAPMPIPQAPI